MRSDSAGHCCCCRCRRFWPFHTQARTTDLTITRQHCSVVIIFQQDRQRMKEKEGRRVTSGQMITSTSSSNHTSTNDDNDSTCRHTTTPSKQQTQRKEKNRHTPREIQKITPPSAVCCAMPREWASEHVRGSATLPQCTLSVFRILCIGTLQQQQPHYHCSTASSSAAT